MVDLEPNNVIFPTRENVVIRISDWYITEVTEPSLAPLRMFAGRVVKGADATVTFGGRHYVIEPFSQFSNASWQKFSPPSHSPPTHAFPGTTNH